MDGSGSVSLSGSDELDYQGVAEIVSKQGFVTNLFATLRRSWAYEQGLQWHTIQPGRPMENAYVESFNGRFRDECLNENWFSDLADAREKIAEWMHDYNGSRPHSALGYRTPAEFRAHQGSISIPPEA